MPDQTPLEIAIGGHRQVPDDWMPASQVGPFVYEDPALVWLEYHGAAHGFQPDSSPYEFGDFIAEIAHQFEAKWLDEMEPGAIRVCTAAQEGREARKVRRTFELMAQGAPVIAQPALWWAPERIYGVPDLLVHTSWLREHWPAAMDGIDSHAAAPYLGEGGQQGHYVVVDLKFTTKLDDRRKAKDLENYAAQVRIYSYMLGQLQGFMPGRAFFITRDRLEDPLPVQISSELGRPLDGDLAAMRDRFVDIKVNGARYLPWRDEVVASNLDHHDDRWDTAKKAIARQKAPGGDASLLYQVGRKAKEQLADLGYRSLADLLGVAPQDVPLEEVKGIGGKRAKQMRAILQANRSGAALLPPSAKIPPRKPFEFYVDFEYFTNVNVDFETQWPALEGCEMVFMIGVGWEEGGRWRFRSFAAERESQDQEMAIFRALLDFFQAKTGGAGLAGKDVVVYHWSSAEVWQTRRVAERYQLPPGHVLRRLPWFDLQKVFLDGPAAVPGAWNFGLKAVAKGLCDLDPAFGTEWPADLDVGLQAMVMGWQAYESGDALNSEEMELLRRYLEADCQALWCILRWLRAGT
jgi:predicted RecB family nuclease